MYKVIRFFTDLKDRDHRYNVGDTYPRSGLNVSAARLAELSGNNNKRGVPLIVDVSPVEKNVVSQATEAVEEVQPVKPKRKRKTKSE